MPRLFVAVEFPDEIKQRLQEVCNGLRGARWARDGQFHLTLRFLGEVEPPKARAIAEVLHGVRADPFELELRGLGHFPPRGRPRVLWAGVVPCEGLDLLYRRVSSVLRRAGIGPEERKFSAHVTLARVERSPAQEVARFAARHHDLRCEPFPVTGFTLFSSFLSREGAQHRAEAVYPLFGRAPA